MSGQHRGRLHDQQARPPAFPAPGEPRPEVPIAPAQPWPVDGPLQHRELLAQRHVLQGHPGRPEHEHAEEGPDTEEKDPGRLPRTQITAETRLYPEAERPVVTLLRDESNGLVNQDTGRSVIRICSGTRFGRRGLVIK